MMQIEATSDLTSVVQRVRAHLGCRIVLVTMLIDDRQVILAHASQALLDEALMALPLDYSVCQHAAAKGRTLVIEDAKSELFLSKNRGVHELGMAAYAGVPIYLGNGANAVLCAANFEPRTWSDDDIAYLEAHATEAAACLLFDFPLGDDTTLPVQAPLHH